MSPSKSNCDHPLLDVYSSLVRAPIATEVTKEEAQSLVNENMMTRYADCTFCGVTVFD